MLKSSRYRAPEISRSSDYDTFVERPIPWWLLYAVGLVVFSFRRPTRHPFGEQRFPGASSKPKAARILPPQRLSCRSPSTVYLPCSLVSVNRLRVWAYSRPNPSLHYTRRTRTSKRRLLARARYFSPRHQFGIDLETTFSQPAFSKPNP